MTFLVGAHPQDIARAIVDEIGKSPQLRQWEKDADAVYWRAYNSKLCVGDKYGIQGQGEAQMAVYKWTKKNPRPHR